MQRKYRIEIAPTVFASLRAVRDKTTRRQLVDAIDGLADDPKAQGKELTGPLAGLWSIHAAADRFRILFRVAEGKVGVVLVGRSRPGQSRDVYALAEALLALLGRRRQGEGEA